MRVRISTTAVTFLALAALLTGLLAGCEAGAKYERRASEETDLAPLMRRARGDLERRNPETILPAYEGMKIQQLSAQQSGPRSEAPRPPPGAEWAFTLASADELWIIEKPSADVPPADDSELPGTGSLVARPPGHLDEVPVPLKHTDVKARVSGYIATVDVTQEFHNPFEAKIEAVYVFPLPHAAAVHDFLMKVGDRTIRGMIREREEAQRTYEAARAQGHVASVLTQERPNIFTQKVANIEPGKSIDISIQYFHTLAYEDGGYEFVFPMVIGPRFNPPGWTDGIAAVAHGAQGKAGQAAAVSYLRPTERSGHDIALEVAVDAGVSVESVECESHVVERRKVSDDSFVVRLSQNDRIPNRDFVLRYRVAGGRVKADLLVQRDASGGYFTLMVFPPRDTSRLERRGQEMVFVLDASGSMSGAPIQKAKQAISRALRLLGPDDTFQLIRFSQQASQLGPAPLPATPENVRRGLAYLETLNSSGGTHMIEGIRAALDFPHDPLRLRTVWFLTDGFIGNEVQILAEVHQRLGATRIFSLGIGNSVNRHLIEGLARLGRGAVAYVGLDSSAAALVDRIHQRIRHPALTDVEVDWGGLEVRDVFPKQIPDLFVGRPVILTGRLAASDSASGGPLVVKVRGRAGEGTVEVPIPVDLEKTAVHEGVASVWARQQIQALSDFEAVTGDAELSAEILRLALEHRLMSRYSAFVAVDSLTRTDGNFGVTVPVPVPVPEGVRYETTVGERR